MGLIEDIALMRISGDLEHIFDGMAAVMRTRMPEADGMARDLIQCVFDVAKDNRESALEIFLQPYHKVLGQGYDQKTALYNAFLQADDSLFKFIKEHSEEITHKMAQKGHDNYLELTEKPEFKGALSQIAKFGTTTLLNWDDIGTDEPEQMRTYGLLVEKMAHLITAPSDKLSIYNKDIEKLTDASIELGKLALKESDDVEEVRNKLKEFQDMLDKINTPEDLKKAVTTVFGADVAEKFYEKFEERRQDIWDKNGFKPPAQDAPAPQKPDIPTIRSTYSFDNTPL